MLGFTALAILLGLSRKPAGATWMQFYGIALLTGVGFTMSLFIGTLAFEDPVHMARVRVGVISGSLLSALAGYAVLRLSTSVAGAEDEEEAP